MEGHCLYVWYKFIMDCPAEKLFIVADNEGAYCVSRLLKNYRILKYDVSK